MRSTLLALAVMASLSACADGPAQQSGGGVHGNTVTIPANRPQMEPGHVFAGNDQAVLKQVRDLVARGDEATDAVIAELEGYGLDKLAPPVLFEYSRRLKLKNNPDWRYWFELASLRAKYDQRACTDASARQFVTVSLMDYSGTLDDAGKSAFLEEAGKDDEGRWKALRRVIDSGAGFNGKASAWWICSHGMGNMSAAMSGRTLPLDSWWVGQSTLDQARKDAETALGAALKAKGY